MKLYISSNNNLISDDVMVADNFVTRSIGLLSKKNINPNQALIIKPCCSIHTLFMKFDIDVLFVRNNKIIALYENVKPYRILPIHPFSQYVIELPAGKIKTCNIKKGDNVL